MASPPSPRSWPIRSAQRADARHLTVLLTTTPHASVRKALKAPKSNEKGVVDGAEGEGDGGESGKQASHEPEVEPEFGSLTANGLFLAPISATMYIM